MDVQVHMNADVNHSIKVLSSTLKIWTRVII